ncbi:SURF1 family protein [Brevibacterium linens]|uniref:SURF1-like protein n=1 Tax=Brevibacterium linens TaxID=1703 RepID=A0A0B9A103_BRELN|nr:SURF1 family protein [Brevibacterium linens]KHS52467.1 Surfeit locus 1 family protein [Brevibacterium linens]
MGSLLLVLVLVTCFVGLSAWQVDRAQHKNDVTDSAGVDELKDFNDVMDAQAPMPGILADQRVSLSGHWIPDAQVVIPGRVQDGDSGYWVVTMFAPDGAHLGEGVKVADAEKKTIAIPVVRGFATDEDTAMNSEARDGQVELTARIGPIEGPVEGNDLPDGQVHTVSTSQIINLFPDLLTYSGFLIPETADGAAASVGTDGLEQVPTTTTRDEGGFDLQSAVYALEWIIFAAMALYMWFQLLRDDYVRRRLGEDSQDSEKRVEYVVVKPAGDATIDPEVMSGLTGLPAHRHGGKKPGKNTGKKPESNNTDTSTTGGNSA